MSKIENQSVSAAWVLNQLAGMSFRPQGGAYDYMKSCLSSLDGEDESRPYLKNKDDLLRQVAHGLRVYDRNKVSDLKVTLCVGKPPDVLQRYEFSLAGFLEAMALDLHWDVRGNWADAHSATVETF